MFYTLWRVYDDTGLKGKHDKLGVEKSLKTTKIPFVRRPSAAPSDDEESTPSPTTPISTSASSGSGSSSSACTPDHMQWFKNAVNKLAGDGVVECKDLASLEMDIRIQSEVYWEERYRGEPLAYLPVACYIR